MEDQSPGSTGLSIPIPGGWLLEVSPKRGHELLRMANSHPGGWRVSSQGENHPAHPGRTQASPYWMP